MKGDIYGLRLVKQRERSHFPRISTVRSLPTQSNKGAIAVESRRVWKAIALFSTTDTNAIALTTKENASTQG
jgi:hypothetical protein